MARPGRAFESRIRVKEDGRAFSERQNARVFRGRDSIRSTNLSHRVVPRDLQSILFAPFAVSFARLPPYPYYLRSRSFIVRLEVFARLFTPLFYRCFYISFN